MPLASQYFLCGLFNSLVVNYLVRMRVTTHVTTATVERLPIPPPECSPSAQREIAAIAPSPVAGASIVAPGHDCNADVAGLYQLTPAEFAHVLGTFPLVATEDKEAARRDVRSHRGTEDTEMITEEDKELEKLNQLVLKRRVCLMYVSAFAERLGSPPRRWSDPRRARSARRGRRC